MLSFLNNRTEKTEVKTEKVHGLDRGILVFADTGETIRAEGLLRKSGWSIRMMGPPPQIRSGCDLVIEFPLIESLRIRQTLAEAGMPPIRIVPVNSPLLRPVDLFQVTDFGRHLMVRAANMKMTIEKKTRVIVNISGGGCPDIPYLAFEMVGKNMDEAPQPNDIGYTLCGYALQLAFEKLKKICSP